MEVFTRLVIYQKNKLSLDGAKQVRVWVVLRLPGSTPLMYRTFVVVTAVNVDLNLNMNQTAGCHVVTVKFVIFFFYQKNFYINSILIKVITLLCQSNLKSKHILKLRLPTRQRLKNCCFLKLRQLLGLQLQIQHALSVTLTTTLVE